MERIWTTQLEEHAGGRVRLGGWLHNLRELSQVTFLLLRDAKGLAQVVVEDPALAQRLGRLQPESVLLVDGLAAREPRAPGGIEIREPSVEVLAPAAALPPVELFRPALAAQLPTLLDHAPVALRHPRRRALFELASASMQGFRRTLSGLGFTEIQTPKIVASATEGGANVFRIDYFGTPAYLAQSPQLYKQVMVGVFERVFEVGPVFRAEPHDTPRHVNEYVSLDVEIGFIQDHTTVMGVLREALAGMTRTLREQAGSACRLLGIEVPEVPAAIPSLHFMEAQELILRETGEDARGEPDLSPAHERWLGEWARREYRSEFLFVVGYPMVKRPFYTYPDPERPEYSRSFDLLFRGLELVTGGQRLYLYQDYLEVMRARGMDPAPFEGCVPARYAAARRFRHRPGAVGRAAGGRGQYPRDHPLPSRPEPAIPVGTAER